MKELIITRPDDWHLHLRDGEVLRAVLADSARRFGRAMIMPNLNPPIITTQDALAYRERIMKATLPLGIPFTPLMTLYLTDHTTPKELTLAHSSGFVFAVGEAFLAGATTNSAYGVSDFLRCEPALATMEELGLPLLLHGEVTDPDVDVFDREAVFIERHLIPIVERFPRLKVVLEHITTREAVAFVEGAGPNIAATITAHHLLLNRNAMFIGGLRPHAYCLPVLKSEIHRQALVSAAVSGNPKFFLGTDSAPHLRQSKESACGCAGIYTSHAAIELYAEAFDAVDAIERLEAFASFHGADFYQLPRNTSTIKLEKRSWMVPPNIAIDGDILIPMRAGEQVGWTIVDESE